MINKIKFFLLITFFGSSFLLSQQPQYFTFMSNTGNNANISIPSTVNPLANNIPLESGDEIGVFTQSGLCVGAAVWTGQNIGITVWGDNDRTTDIDGLGNNEKMNFRIWRKSENREYQNVTVTYNASNPMHTHDGLYTPNALYVIATMSALSTPTRPTLVYPKNGESGLSSLELSFSWDTVQASDSYILQISKDTFFIDNTQMIFDDSFPSNTGFVTNLEKTTKYYWRVAAVNDAGASLWSNIWSFYTMKELPEKPVLTFPSHNTSGLPTTLVLSWNPTPRADYYEIEISFDRNFISIYKTETNILIPYFEVVDLPNGWEFSWQVRAFNESGSSVFSEPFIFRTVPYAPSPYSPVDGQTGISTLPLLQWSNISNAISYNLVITTAPNDPGATVQNISNISTNNYTVINPLMNNQIYYWMVSANILGGNTTSWSLPFRFKTRLAAPSLYSPSNNASSVSTRPTFSWSQITNAVYYNIQISETSDFINPIDQTGIINSSYMYSQNLKGVTTYYWRVRAINYEGEGDWSMSQSFTTLLTPPDPPRLSSPTNDSYGHSLRPNFIWESSSRATSYTIQVTNNLYNWNNLVFYRTGVTGTYVSTDFDLQYYTDYYWRVSATNSVGESEWSPVSRFTTRITSPAIVSPANGSTAIPATPTVTWTAVPGASAYNLQISSNPDNWSSPIVNRTGLTTNSVSVNATLEYNTVYYARVSASNGGDIGDWSNIIYFITSIAPPTLYAPLSGASGVSLTPVFEWYSVEKATSYHLQISASIDNWYSPIFEQNNITATYLLSTATLQNFRTYYWRVRSANSYENSEWSSIRQFTTKIGSPTIVHPSNQATWIDLIPQFVWNPVSGASGYAIQVSTNQTDWNNLVINIDPISTATVISPISLTHNRNYFWRIATNSGSGKSEWSEVFTFRTYPAYPSSIHLNTTIEFPHKSNASKYNSEDYKLVGLPGASNILVSSLFTTEHKKDWNAFLDNGQTSNYMIEYDGSELFRFRVGKAFWIISNNDISINQSVQTAPLNSQLEMEIPLQVGWNIITNPYLYNINWERVLQYNNINTLLWNFFNGGFEVSNILEPYRGYYFDNGSNLSYLKIPYSYAVADINANITEDHTQKEKPEVDIAINFKSTHKDNGDAKNANGSIKIGIVNNTKEVESFNHKKPKSSLLSKNIALTRSENPIEDYATDYRTNITGCERWDFTIKTLEGETNTIDFSNIASLPLFYEIYLFDYQNQTKFNLRVDSSYSFYSKSKINKFSIFIGKESTIEKEINSINKPDKFEILQNYPNPFNPETKIPIRIANAGIIRIKIFNILGKEIYTLFDGNLEAGTYTFEWKGIDNSGISLPSGTYFIRMFSSSNNLQVTRKIMLLR